MSFETDLNEVQSSFRAAFKSSELTQEKLEALRIQFVGRKGKIPAFFDQLTQISNEKRPHYGKKINELKQDFQSLYKKAKEEFSNNFITVGASTINYNKNLIANFSNYGADNVDIFAPGYNVYSLLPENDYESLSGTSMAAPAVSGVASLILSYFPRLSAQKLKSIILESGIKVDIKIDHDDKENIYLDSISRTGKIVNAYNALILASKSKRK